MRILFLLLISLTSFGQSFLSSTNGGPKAGVTTRYYISASGNDANDGLTPATAITTAKIASLSFGPIDSLVFKRGDVFVIGDISNLSYAIGVNAYGSGAKPKITGSKDLSAVTWTSEGGGIYSTVLAYTPLWVYQNGVVMPIAATANLTASSIASNVITVSSITPLSGYAGSFVGAKLRGYANTWILSDEYTVTAYNSGAKTITLSGPPAAGMLSKSCFLYAQQQFLTSGSWFFDTSTSKLYVFTTTSPSGTDIRAGFYNTFISSKVQLNMSNIELLNYHTNAITYGTRSFIDNNLIHDCRGTGLFGNFSDHSWVTNNTVHHCDLNGIFSFRGDNTVYANNTIYDICSGSSLSRLGFPTNSDALEIGNAGYPISVTGQEFMAYSITSMRETGILMTKNNIYNIGYVGIFVSSSYGGNDLIDKNYVHDHTGIVLTDGGLIYTAGHINYVNDGATFSNNVIENGGTSPGNVLTGVYVDNFSNNIKVTNNSVYKGGPFAGIRLNSGTKNSVVTGNKVVGDIYAQGCVRWDEAGGFPFTNSGCTFTGNQMAMMNNAGVMVFSGGINPFSGGGSSNNNVYVYPYDDTNIIRRVTSMNLATWKTVLSTDAASTSRTNYITFSNITNANQEVKMERNPTDAAVSFNVPAGYSDVTGAAFSNPVSIPAYSSLIYLKDTAFP